MSPHGSPADLGARTRQALDLAIAAYRGGEHEPRLRELRRRLDEPLRVAVAGRVKAGKSTLLNALVGERLAPTDAGECTRVVTWYRDGHTYRVDIHPRDRGPARQARFARENGALEVDLGGLSPEQVDHLDVTWPSQELRTATLIDTPGVGSLTDDASMRAWELLAPEEEETQADAVIYLMRHMHGDDVEFLSAFHDSDVGAANPVNAIGVLSRADEIGGGRLDTMASARRIAGRMATDPAVRRLVQTVVPVAGLLAETAVSLTETEVAQLRRVAELPPRAAEDLLLSADRFLTAMPELGLTEIERTALLGRLGVFGVRLATTLLRRDGSRTAGDLARELSERSGLRQLQETLDSLFFERREILKSRSTLFAVETLLRTVPPRDPGDLPARIEEIIASAHPFNELRVLSALRAGWISGKPAVIADLEQVIGGNGAAAQRRLGLPEDAGPTQIAEAAQQALARWQRRAENPLTGHEMVMAARVAIRSCEGLLAELYHRSRASGPAR